MPGRLTAPGSQGKPASGPPAVFGFRRWRVGKSASRLRRREGVHSVYGASGLDQVGLTHDAAAAAAAAARVYSGVVVVVAAVVGRPRGEATAAPVNRAETAPAPGKGEEEPAQGPDRAREAAAAAAPPRALLPRPPPPRRPVGDVGRAVGVLLVLSPAARLRTAEVEKVCQVGLGLPFVFSIRFAKARSAAGRHAGSLLLLLRLLLIVVVVIVVVVVSVRGA
ncbi:MAG: hypothetical protein BJ554DRAFT_7386 [Olpidium bornovanus]|uniref:Uncharacterized protein n=1 Tax=Olpidium bornovanus TaxID=278681 RepID=A0A8H8DJA4_9FUNG|nr:MAG: hypothetical protein BJ554DRAFT_7386 [Olpidium bornovanus]